MAKTLAESPLTGTLVSQGQPQDGAYLTNVPFTMDAKHPPFMRQVNRWEYLKEYIYDFWLLGKKAQIKALVFAVGGLFALPHFAPGALVLFALTGRYYSIGWWGANVANTFGKKRTLVIAK